MHPKRHPRFLISIDLPCRDCWHAVMDECNKRHIMYNDDIYTRTRCTGEVWCQTQKQHDVMQTWLASYLRANHPDLEGDHYVQ